MSTFTERTFTEMLYKYKINHVESANNETALALNGAMLL